MLLGLGVLVQIVVDLWIGGRLLRLAQRTRGLLELGFGACLLLFGGLGIPAAAVARLGPFASDGANQSLLIGALGLENLGSFALFLATWRVFRPNAKWARSLVWIAGGVFLVATPMAASSTGGAASSAASPFSGAPSRLRATGACFADAAPWASRSRSSSNAWPSGRSPAAPARSASSSSS